MSQERYVCEQCGHEGKWIRTVNALVRPVRIQLSRRKGWRMPPNTVNVSRPSRYGNPHRIGPCPICGADHTRNEAIAELRAEIESDPMLQERIREELAGKNLACWCKPNEPCHGDILLEVANDHADISAASADKVRRVVGLSGDGS